jgi:hypothetical protein
MTNDEILIFSLPGILALIEWYVVISYVLFWHDHPRTLVKSIAATVFCICPILFLYLETGILSKNGDYDAMTNKLYYCEVFGTLCVTVGLLFVLGIKKEKLTNNIGNRSHRPLSKTTLGLILRGILALLLTLFCVFLVPQSFLQEHIFLASLLGGVLLNIFLITLRVKNSNAK